MSNILPPSTLNNNANVLPPPVATASGYVLLTGDTMTGALAINSGTITASDPALNATQTWNSGAVVFTGLKLNITNTASAATSMLMDLQVGGVSQFSVTRAGITTLTGALTAQNATAIPAGGTAGAGLMVSSTANFGIFFGSGAPSLSAAKGSIYLRSNGSGTTDRMYINTNGGTTWTNVVTSA